jgi:hypothetical protein
MVSPLQIITSTEFGPFEKSVYILHHAILRHEKVNLDQRESHTDVDCELEPSYAEENPMANIS